MASSVLLGDLQQENLVLLECQLRKSEDDALALVPAHNRGVVADPQRFDDALLLSRAFGRLAVRDDKAAIVHLEGDVRVVGNLHMEVDHVVVDVDPPHLELHAVFPGVNSLYVCAVLAVYVAQHAFYRGRTSRPTSRSSTRPSSARAGSAADAGCAAGLSTTEISMVDVAGFSAYRASKV